MAGLSGTQHVVDIVAASEQLAPSAASVSLEVAPAAPTDVGSCALGHPNTASARFCAECGLSMSAQAPPSPAGQAARPKPAAELTDEEKAERERQHQQAIAAAAAFEAAPEQIVPSEGEAVLIHFVEDGLTAFGRVWYRGQELAIGPDHPRWAEARGWVTLDKAGQYERWGKQYFDSGPWPFQHSYVDPGAQYEKLKVIGGEGSVPGPDEEALRRADAAERARGRGVPAPALR